MQIIKEMPGLPDVERSYPWGGKWRKFKWMIKVKKDLFNTINGGKRGEKINYKFDIEHVENGITVSLSWNENRKSVINWMEKHMEAFPETLEGFKVKFIDDPEAWGFIVQLCKDSEENYDIEIAWNKYKISKYTDRRNHVNPWKEHSKDIYARRSHKGYKNIIDKKSKDIYKTLAGQE